jgi:endonuclease/exonuclease/phosphatase family metal-dependent hydrolase
MQKLSVGMESLQKAQMCALLPSVEAGDFNKVPDHLTWPVITLYPLDSADIQLTLPPAKSIVVSFLNKMTPTSFKPYHCHVGNVSAVVWNVPDNGLCVVCMKPNYTNTTVS